MSSNQLSGIGRAVQIAGSQADLSRLMRDKAGYCVTQQCISVWVKRGKPVAEAVPAICTALDYAIKAHDLRPDLFSVA